MKLKNTCTDFITMILKRGGRWRNKQIEEAILRDYGMSFQNNTIAKYLSFLMKEGKALSAPVRTHDGEICAEYWWVAVEKKKETYTRLTVFQFLEMCRTIADTYPIDHPQLEKIDEQCKRFEKMEHKEATYV